jgi:hypothetical protein
VVSGIEWDSEANNGKGGIKFTTAAVATSEGLENVQGRLAKLEAEVGDAENNYANSRIDALEKTISDNQANWAKDDNTTYTFTEVKDSYNNIVGIEIAGSDNTKKSIGFDFLTEEAVWSILNPTYEGEADWLYLNNVQVNDLSAVNRVVFTDDGAYEQDLVADYENKTFKIKQGTTEKTIATVDQIPGIKVNNAGHADSADSATNASKLGGQEPSYYATAGYIESMVGGLTSGAFQVGAAIDADKLGGQVPSYYAVDSLVIHSSEKGNANGVATLGEDGKVPASQLPSYVDDVVEYSNKTSFPSTGEAGKIYVAQDTNITYRWSGTAYVEISASLALGETSSTAYSGDKGKANADAIADIQGKYQPKILTTAVNGKTTVEESLADLNSRIAAVDYPVTSVNGKTGAVTLGSADIAHGETTVSGQLGYLGANKADKTELNSYVKLTGDQNVKGTKTFEKVVLENAGKTNSITINPTVDGNEFYTPGIKIEGLTYEDTGPKQTLDLSSHGVSLSDENENTLVSIGFTEGTDAGHFSGSVYIHDTTSDDSIEFFGSEIQRYVNGDYEMIYYPSRGGTLAVKEDIPTNVVQYDQKETPDAWFSDANVLIINCGSSKFQN